MIKQRVTYKPILFALALLFALSGCMKLGEFYVGLHLQPDMEDAEKLQGLNVFGILKSGTDFDTVSYHFEVQRMLDVMLLEEEMQVYNASITLERFRLASGTTAYNLKPNGKGNYINEDIDVLPGDSWTIKCIVDSFEVSANCIVPQLPVLGDPVLNFDENTIAFNILKDTSAFIYSIYLFQDQNQFYDLVLPDTHTVTNILASPSWKIEKGNSVEVFVCAYDVNFKRYLTTSNTFFKPNAYRPPFSTVDGGYGVFGAVSIAKLDID